MSKQQKIKEIKEVLIPPKRGLFKVFIGENPEPFYTAPTKDCKDFIIQVSDLEQAKELKKLIEQG